MNKLTKLIAFCVLALSLGANAQEGNVGTPAAEYPILKNKLKKSEEATSNPKKTANPKFWLSRAELLMAVYEVNLQHIGKGASIVNMKILFGDPNEVKTEVKEGQTYEIHVHDNLTITYLNKVVDSYVETNKIHENPLPEALVALEKTEELDVDKKLTKKIKEGYDRLKPLFERQGLELYIVEDYKGAFGSFQKSIVINQKEMNASVIDTVIIFNAGMTASKAELPKESIKYYELARSYNYPEPALYVYLKNKYYQVNDTLKGVEVLKDGFQRFPENSDIVIELINYYLAKDEAEEALEYLKIAQEKDPQNVSLVFAEATLYDKNDEIEKAIKVYQKCIDLQPDFYNGYFNMGVVYYNKAQQMYDAGSDIKNDKEYREHIKKADEVLSKAMAPMEKCLELQPEDASVIDVLKSVYYRLKMTEKYEEMKARAEAAK